MVEGHNPSVRTLPTPFLEGVCTSLRESRLGVDGLGGEGGVDGRLRSADTDRLANKGVEETDLVTLGEELLLGTVCVGKDGEEVIVDLYLDGTSLVGLVFLEKALFFSEGTKGGLGISSAIAPPFLSSSTCSASQTSIHTIQITPH